MSNRPKKAKLICWLFTSSLLVRGLRGLELLAMGTNLKGLTRHNDMRIQLLLWSTFLLAHCCVTSVSYSGACLSLSECQLLGLVGVLSDKDAIANPFMIVASFYNRVSMR